MDDYFFNEIKSHPRQGWKIPEIRAHVVGSYYLMDFALDETR